MVDEGIIADQGDIAKKIVEELKVVYAKFFANKEKYRIDNIMALVSDQFWKKYRLKISYKTSPIELGSYFSMGSPEQGYIEINSNFFIKHDELVDPEDVDWEKLTKTIEHEFIHKVQHARADKAFNQVFSAPALKKFKSSDRPDRDRYVNKNVEIMPRVIEVANHIIDNVEEIGNLGEDGRYYAILSALDNFKNPIFIQTLSNFYEFIKYYTPENRKRFFKLLYQTLDKWKEQAKEKTAISN